MKRSIRGFVVAVMMSASIALVAQAQPAPAPAPGNAAPGRGFGVGRGGRGGFTPVVIGEPAPVPPEVALPTAAEVTQINDALKKFVETNTSPVKPLLQKYEAMLMVPAPRLNTAATYTQTQQRRGARHEDFVEIAKKGDIDLLLDGDSITDLWASDTRNPDKKVVYDKYFGKYKTANFAISGDTTQGVLWGLKNGEGQGFSPKAIMVMIGTNNTGTNTAPEIAAGVGAVVLEMRKDFPNAKILLLAIFPRGLPNDPLRDKIAEINQSIAKLDDQQHVFYMDIGPKFLDDKGVLIAGSFQADNLHPTAKGYEIWGEAVKDKLAELMK